MNIRRILYYKYTEVKQTIVFPHNFTWGNMNYDNMYKELTLNYILNLLRFYSVKRKRG